MSDNKLLAENTIRRFMKLANVDTFTDSFLSEAMKGAKHSGTKSHDDKDPKKEGIEEENDDNLEEMGGKTYEKDEDKLEEEELEEGGVYAKHYGEKDEDKLEEEFDLDEEIESLYEEEDEEGEEGEEGMAGDAGAMAAAAPGAADLSLSEEEAQVIIDLGKRLQEAMAGAEPEGEDEATAGMDDMGGEAGADDMGDMGGMEDEEEALAESTDALVQEVLKRVTKSLVAAKLGK